MMDERDRVFWLAIRRALLMIASAIFDRYCKDMETTPLQKRERAV